MPTWNNEFTSIIKNFKDISIDMKPDTDTCITYTDSSSIYPKTLSCPSTYTFECTWPEKSGINKNKTLNDLINKLLEDDECEELNIDRIIFNDPATIIFWSDGEKTVVKAAEGDTFNPYYGFCCAVTKRIFGNNSAIKKLIKRKCNNDGLNII